MNSFLELNGKRFQLTQLDEITPCNEFENDTISFIKNWKTGQKKFIQQTSVSTGKPKLIEITRNQMVASAELTTEALNLQPNENGLLCLSPTYIAGKMMIVRALINGMNIVALNPESDPFLCLKSIVDFVAITPMQLHSIFKSDQSILKLNNTKNVIIGGGAIGESLTNKIENLKTNCYSTFGMTETVSHIALKKLNGVNKSNYFRAFEGIKLGTDPRNCLTIKGAITDHKNIITNDRVLLINQHEFEWLGRVDNVINSGGIKVQSETVESAVEKVMNQLKIDNSFFVAGIKDPEFGEKVSLLIEEQLTESHILNIKNLLKDLLSKYELPKQIHCVKTFKYTDTGKIDKANTLKISGFEN